MQRRRDRGHARVMTDTTLTHRSVAALAQRQGGVVLRRQAHESGMTHDQIRSLVRQGHWTALHHGVYLTTARGPDPRPPLLARLWAAHLRCGPNSVIAMGGAARLLRLQGLPEAMPHVDVILPRGRHLRPDLRLRLHSATLGPGEVVLRRGLPTTSAVRTLADLLLRVPEEQGLSLLDSALRQGLVTDLSAVDRALRYRPRADRARAVLPLADGRAESPLESVTRLDCVRGGVPPDELQYRVLDRSGRQLARTDFCWRRGLRRPLLGEVDGRGERTLSEPVGTERFRQNRLTLGDYALIRFTWADTEQPGQVAAMVRAALDELRISRPPVRAGADAGVSAWAAPPDRATRGAPG